MTERQRDLSMNIVKKILGTIGKKRRQLMSFKCKYGRCAHNIDGLCDNKNIHLIPNSEGLCEGFDFE